MRRLVIKGDVQGVGFRYHLADQARVRHLDGWCANRSNGNVECVLSGPAELVAEVLAWCEHGPPHASVDEVRIEPLDGYDGPDGFEIRR